MGSKIGAGVLLLGVALLAAILASVTSQPIQRSRGYGYGYGGNDYRRGASVYDDEYDGMPMNYEGPRSFRGGSYRSDRRSPYYGGGYGRGRRYQQRRPSSSYLDDDYMDYDSGEQERDYDSIDEPWRYVNRGRYSGGPYRRRGFGGGGAGGGRRGRMGGDRAQFDGGNDSDEMIDPYKRRTNAGTPSAASGALESVLGGVTG